MPMAVVSKRPGRRRGEREIRRGRSRRRGENGVEGTGERKGGDRRCLRVLMHAAENTFYKRTRFMREHVLQENMFYKRTHSIKEHILSENTFYKRTCSK